MTVHKLRGTLQDYFDRMVGRTIEEVAIFDNELVLFLDDESEVCIFENEQGLCMQINDRQELND
jgi:hypothetical protein